MSRGIRLEYLVYCCNSSNYVCDGTLQSAAIGFKTAHVMVTAHTMRMPVELSFSTIKQVLIFPVSFLRKRSNET